MGPGKRLIAKSRSSAPMSSPHDREKSSDPHAAAEFAGIDSLPAGQTPHRRGEAEAEAGPDRQFELALVRHVHDLQNSLWPLSVEADLSATDSTLPASVCEMWAKIGRSVQEAMTIAALISEVVDGHFQQPAPQPLSATPRASRAPVDALVASNRATTDEPATTSAPQAPVRPMRVLCVDNDANVLATLSQILKHLKHEVVVCQSGSEALSLFAAGRFDVVMTDLDMTGMDGRAVTRKIRASSNTPVIWATGEDFSKAADRIDESEQPDCVLPKPVSLNSLRQALAAVTAAKPTQ
jgi:CheY-like chemotaxis protein